jgi:hypothetical protein
MDHIQLLTNQLVRLTKIAKQTKDKDRVIGLILRTALQFYSAAIQADAHRSRPYLIEFGVLDNNGDMFMPGCFKGLTGGDHDPGVMMRSPAGWPLGWVR